MLGAHLYGQNTEYTQVTEAWNAVGVYDNEVAWDYLLCGELGGTKTYQAMHEIRVNKLYCGNNEVVINDIANIEFKAGNRISLQKGFRTEYGAYFRASISTDICADMFPKVGGNMPNLSQQLLSLDVVPAQVPLLLVYPNPVSGRALVRYKTFVAGSLSMLLIDANGNVVRVLKQATSQKPGIYESHIDCSNLAPGIYVCVLAAGSGVVSQTFIVQ